MMFHLLVRGVLHAMSCAKNVVVGHSRMTLLGLAIVGGVFLLALALWI